MIVSVDVGSHKVTTLAGEVLPDGGVRLLGMGHAEAGGIRAGEVVHIEEAAAAIAMSVERAERLGGLKIGEAVVGIATPTVEGAINHAVFPCGRRPRPITPLDVDRVLDVAGTVPVAGDRAVVHVLPRFYQVDDGARVVSPVGMEGHRLQAEVYIVTTSAAAVGNMRRCLARAEVVPTGLVISMLAAGEAVLSADERELGVLLIDLGASGTGLASYVDGALAFAGVVPVGGKHMTSDISVVLQTPLAEAERIKTAHGHVLPEMDDDSTEIDVVPFGQDGHRTATRRYVSEVLAERADEVADLVMAEVDRAGLRQHLPAGAVLVGGGTELAGLPQRFGERLGMPVRVGRPSRLLGLADAARGPAHAGAVGLLLWASRAAPDAATRRAPADTTTESELGRAMAWLRRAFLPGGRGSAG